MRPSPARSLRSVFLAFSCFAALSFPLRLLAASGPDEPLTLLVSVSPERPSSDAAFIVTILVDYPDPSGTSVRPPSFPSTIALDRTRTEPHLVRGTSGRDERWTAIEFTFTLRSEEDFVLGPFEVSVPGKWARTEPMTIRVSPSQARQEARGGGPTANLVWRDVPASIRAGEAAELTLVLEGERAPKDAELSAEAPENALLETSPPKPQDGEAGIVGRFKLTALQGPSVRLPVVTFSMGGTNTLRSPGGSIAVSAAAARASPAATPARSASRGEGAETEGENPKAQGELLFPEAPGLPAPLRFSAEKTLSLARSAWSSGDRAIALAALRAAERDTIAGFALTEIRREAERSLGIENAPNERYAPTSALIGLAIASVLLAIIAFFTARRVTSGGHRGFKVAILFLVLACVSVGRLLVVRLDAAGVLGRGVAAVAPACIAYRIPEKEGGASARFAEGEAIRLRSSAGSWIYAEAADGRSGWVEGLALIRY